MAFLCILGAVFGTAQAGGVNRQPEIGELLAAITDDRVDTVAAMVKREPSLLRKWGQRFKDSFATPLHCAADRRNVRMIRLLVELGADVNTLDGGRSGSPLMHASEAGPNPAADELLKLGARLDPHSAAALGKVKELEGMMNFARLFRFENWLLNSALVKWSVSGRQWATTELLLKRGANPNRNHTFGGFLQHNPAHKAIWHQSPFLIPLLVRHKADLEAFDFAGRTPLHCAVEGGDTLAVAVLMAFGAKQTRYSKARHIRPSGGLISKGQLACSTPLHLAASDVGDLTSLAIMLALGADPNVTDGDGRTPLDHCPKHTWSGMASRFPLSVWGGKPSGK